MTVEAPAAPDIFARYRDRIDAALREAVAGPDLQLYTMVRYHLGWVDEAGKPARASQGKALRPTLCLLMCQALGGDQDSALPAAAGLELLHNFSLIHDDVMDDDRTRHHRPTVWTIWGKPQAINAGDLLNVLATLSVLRSAHLEGDIRPTLDAVAILSHGCARMTEGQYLDLAFESRRDVSVADYLEMVEGKSAALFAAAFEIGAVFAGNDLTQRDQCRAYGQALGTAFQIRDDVLGIWGDPKQTGKPVGSDIAKRKKSLPIVHALAQANNDDRSRLREMLADTGHPPDVAAATGILDRAGSHEFAEAEADRFAAAAERHLSELDVSAWGRAALREMAGFITGRQH